MANLQLKPKLHKPIEWETVTSPDDINPGDIVICGCGCRNTAQVWNKNPSANVKRFYCGALHTAIGVYPRRVEYRTGIDYNVFRNYIPYMNDIRTIGLDPTKSYNNSIRIIRNTYTDSEFVYFASEFEKLMKQIEADANAQAAYIERKKKALEQAQQEYRQADPYPERVEVVPPDAEVQVNQGWAVPGGGGGVAAAAGIRAGDAVIEQAPPQPAFYQARDIVVPRAANRLPDLNINLAAAARNQRGPWYRDIVPQQQVVENDQEQDLVNDQVRDQEAERRGN